MNGKQHREKMSNRGLGSLHESNGVTSLKNNKLTKSFFIDLKKTVG